MDRLPQSKGSLKRTRDDVSSLSSSSMHPSPIRTRLRSAYNPHTNEMHGMDMLFQAIERVQASEPKPTKALKVASVRQSEEKNMASVLQPRSRITVTTGSNAELLSIMAQHGIVDNTQTDPGIVALRGYIKNTVKNYSSLDTTDKKRIRDTILETLNDNHIRFLDSEGSECDPKTRAIKAKIAGLCKYYGG